MTNDEVFLIAEIGINHNGSLDIATNLIDLAIKYRWNAVKFQKRNVKKLSQSQCGINLRKLLGAKCHISNISNDLNLGKTNMISLMSIVNSRGWTGLPQLGI